MTVSEDPEGSGLKSTLGILMPFIAGAPALIVAVAGVIGLSQSDARWGRITATHTGWVALAITLLCIGIATGSLAMTIQLRKTEARGARLVGASLLCISLSMVVLVSTAIFSITRPDSPQVTISAEPKPGGPDSVTVSAQAGEIPQDNYIALVVYGDVARLSTADPPLRPAVRNRLGSGWDTWWDVVYTSRIGPSPDGKIDVKIVVPIQTGRYDAVAAVARFNAKIGPDEPEGTDDSGQPAPTPAEETPPLPLQPWNEPPLAVYCSGDDETQGCARLLIRTPY